MALRLKDVKNMRNINLQGVTPKRGRYRVADKENRTMDGVVFDSKAEMGRYATLKLGVRAGMVKDLELQPEFPVDINGQRYCVYTADFRYRDDLGNIVVEEVKSEITQKEKDYRLRKKAAELYYGLKIREFVAR